MKLKLSTKILIAAAILILLASIGFTIYFANNYISEKETDMKINIGSTGFDVVETNVYTETVTDNITISE